MTTEEKIAKLINNMQEEFAGSYSNLTRHLKRHELTKSMIADFANIDYELMRHYHRRGEASRKRLLSELKKVDIDKLALRFIKKH